MRTIEELLERGTPLGDAAREDAGGSDVAADVQADLIFYLDVYGSAAAAGASLPENGEQDE